MRPEPWPEAPRVTPVGRCQEEEPRERITFSPGSLLKDSRNEWLPAHARPGLPTGLSAPSAQARTAKAKASPQHLPEVACELSPNGTDADAGANLLSGGFLKSGQPRESGAHLARDFLDQPPYPRSQFPLCKLRGSFLIYIL